MDRARFDKTVASLVDEIDRKPFPGRIEVRTEPVRVESIAPRTGRTADPDEVGRLLERAIRRRGGSSVTIPIASKAVASRAEVDGVARAAEKYLAKPLKLTGAGKALEVSPEQLANVVALESLDGGRRVRLGAGDKRVGSLVDQLAPARERAPRNAKITASNPGASLTDKGDLTWRPRSAKVKVTGGRPGREVRREETAKAIQSAIREGSHSTKLLVRSTGANVSRDDADAVDQLIGTFTTIYVPGQPRVTNIRKMAATVDGTVIAPRAQFSLNGIVGERTKAKGYLPAPFIAEGNKLEDSVGGGVSQFSTTMYNAAYFAGLKIDSHTPHSFYISRYPAGREATLNFGSIDLLWTNDTRTPIFIKTASDDTSVTVSLYGSNGGRRVTASSAPRVSRPGGGFSVKITRSVKSPGRGDRDRRLHHHLRRPGRGRVSAARPRVDRDRSASSHGACFAGSSGTTRTCSSCRSVRAVELSEYQRASRATAVYPDAGRNLLYPTLGLCGEAGEVAEKVKKMLRDDGGSLTDQRRTALGAELGDVLWYVAQVATEAGLDLDALAAGNLEKLRSRAERGALTGDGDER